MIRHPYPCPWFQQALRWRFPHPGIDPLGWQRAVKGRYTVYRKPLLKVLRRMELDRRGQSLVSGGDYDLALCAVDLGLGVGKFCRLNLRHLMPSFRFEENYLLQLWRSVHCSGKVLRYLRTGTHNAFNRTFNQKIRRMARLATGGGKDIHFRFGVAAENGLRDADKIIATFGQE